MRRVMFVAPSAYVLGGVQSWLDYLAAGLPGHEWQVIVGLPSGPRHDAHAYMAAHPRLPAFAIENPTGTREGRVRAIEAALRARPCDAVVGVNIPDALEASMRVRADGKPMRVVAALHGIQPDMFDDLAAYAGALDGVVCSNHLSIALAHEHGVPAHRLYYAPYGVPLREDRLERSGAGGLTLAYVGRIEQWQKRVLDVPPILDALQERGVEFKMLVAGDGPDAASLRAGLERHTERGRVQWLGAVAPHELTEKVYGPADVLLLPSLWETGPIVAWEAMAHGVAVASATYVGSGLERALVDGRNCLMFPVGDFGRAASQIERLADAAFRESLTRSARDLVRTRYSLPESVRSWATALDAIARSPVVRSTQAPAKTDAGRLDRWLGPRWAETARRLARRKFEHTSAGGEWPHSYGCRDIGDAAFWKRAADLDRGAP